MLLSCITSGGFDKSVIKFGLFSVIELYHGEDFFLRGNPTNRWSKFSLGNLGVFFKKKAMLFALIFIFLHIAVF